MFDLTFLANKIMGAVAALIGVAGFAVFYIPPKLRGKPALMVGMLIGGVAVGFSVLFSDVVGYWLGLDMSNPEIRIAVNGVGGIVSIPIMGWLANFVEARQEKDIIEVVADLRNASDKDKEV